MIDLVVSPDVPADFAAKNHWNLASMSDKTKEDY